MRRSGKAESDLIDIGLYIANDNPGAAWKLLSKFDEIDGLLEQHPRMGRVVPGRPDLRTFVVGNYVVVYREVVGGIEILRYLHGRRDRRDLL